eukprot:6102611-Lingulodinium_polyedra.AAC.1
MPQGGRLGPHPGEAGLARLFLGELEGGSPPAAGLGRGHDKGAAGKKGAVGEQAQEAGRAAGEQAGNGQVAAAKGW